MRRSVYLLARYGRLLTALAVAGVALRSSANPNSSTATVMSSSPEYTLVQVPARAAGLAFSYLRPADFRAIELPEESPDFDQPTSFLPLQVAMASYGAVLFSVAARPAYDDGSVEDWAEFLARESQVEIVSLRPSILAGMPAMQVEARQQTEAGVMRLRTVLIEDGKRLLNLSVMAPDAIWASVEPTLQAALSSFRLAESSGTSTPLTRAAAKKLAETAAPAESNVTAEETVAAVGSQPTESQPASPAQLALADDAGTLDPEHPFNVRLRDNGAGLTPRVLETHVDEKYAVIGGGAVEATFRVPFGWHAIDDGKRVLVFDAAGKIQISLNLRRDDGDHRAMLEHILEQAREEQPQIDPELLDFAPDMPGLVLRNYRDGDDVLVQAFVVKQVRDDGLAHVARVTAAPDDMTRAMNLAEVILRSLNEGAVLAGR